ncbi:MAG: family 16 glycoside hydrolase, partial [Bacteroidota bacterium]
MKEILYNYAYYLVKSNFMRVPMLLCCSLILGLGHCAERSGPETIVLGNEWQAFDWLQGQVVEGNWGSKETFGDFALRGEFFLDEGQTNLIRLRQQEQAFSEGGYPISLSYETGQQNTLGTIIGYARAGMIDSIPRKAWNRFEIQAQGPEITVFINDQLLTQCQDQAFAEGKIVFQATHELVGLEEQFRNLELKALPTLPTGPDLDSLRKAAGANANSVLQSSLQGWHQSGSASWELVDGVLTGQSGKEGGYLISDS